MPFYREMWTRRRRDGDRASWETLENWPILPKESVRDDPHAFISEKARMSSLIETETSGSTGTPLRLWQSHDMLVSWYALFEARVRSGICIRCKSRVEQEIGLQRVADVCVTEWKIDRT